MEILESVEIRQFIDTKKRTKYTSSFSYDSIDWHKVKDGSLLLEGEALVEGEEGSDGHAGTHGDFAPEHLGNELFCQHWPIVRSGDWTKPKLFDFCFSYNSKVPAKKIQK